MANLLTFPTLVESPFIIVKIGDYTFGSATKSGNGNYLNVTFPNYMESLTVTKVNGQVNSYNLKMIYPIVAGEDPNKFEKIFSSVSDTRTLTISYGDWAYPSAIYKDEETLITNIRSEVDFSDPKIIYTIQCVSKALNLTSTAFNFPGRKAKPSDVLLSMLSNQAYALSDVFTGMKNKNKVIYNNLIASDDVEVQLDAQPCLSTLEYMNYLVSSMKSQSDDSIYRLSIVDDTKNEYGGSYFSVSKISSNIQESTLEDSYVIDVGYPGNNFVTNFSVSDTEQWSILYKTSEKVDIPNYTFKIDNYGGVLKEKSVSVTRNRELLRTTNEDLSWWKSMTEFPISATLTVKGLVRPTMLMSYVRLNCLFYGQKHVSSGVYIITKQVDSISKEGYKTTLNLLRVRGDLSNVN